MAFERKEVVKEKPANIFWTILKWYWIIVPFFYLIVILPEASAQAMEGEVVLNQLFTTMYQLTNLGFAGILTLVPPIEQSRVGSADKVLKIAAIQQLLIQNGAGFVLTIIAWYKLPHKVSPELIPSEEEQKTYFKPKTLYVLAGIVLGLSVLTLVMQLTVK